MNSPNFHITMLTANLQQHFCGLIWQKWLQTEVNYDRFGKYCYKQWSIIIDAMVVLSQYYTILYYTIDSRRSDRVAYFLFLLTPLVTSNWRFLSNRRWCHSIETYLFIKGKTHVVFMQICVVSVFMHIVDQNFKLTCTNPWFHLPQTLCSSQDIPSPLPQP